MSKKSGFKTRIMDVLLALYDQPVEAMYHISTKHKVSSTVNSAIKKLGYVVGRNGMFYWANPGVKPTEDDVARIIQWTHQQRMKWREYKEEEKEPQMKINFSKNFTASKTRTVQDDNDAIAFLKSSPFFTYKIIRTGTEEF